MRGTPIQQSQATDLKDSFGRVDSDESERAEVFCAPKSRFRFESFEVNCACRELRHKGLRVELRGKPFAALIILLEHAGNLVTREELCHQLWPSGVHVDFESNLSTALRNVRKALDDSSRNPKFIETVRGRGYRFIEPVFSLDAIDSRVNHISLQVSVPEVRVAPAQPSANSEAKSTNFVRLSLPRRWLLAFACLTMTLLGYLVSTKSTVVSTLKKPHPIILVLPFKNASVNANPQTIEDGITDEMIDLLSRTYAKQFLVIRHDMAMRYQGTTKSTLEMDDEVSGFDYRFEGAVRHVDKSLLVCGQLFRKAEHAAIWADCYDSHLGNALLQQRDVAEFFANKLAVQVTRSGSTPGPPERGGL